MKKSKKIIILAIVVVISILGVKKIDNKLEWGIAKEAIGIGGGYPAEMGLVGVTVTPCFTTGSPPICAGGVTCFVSDPVRCLTLADVTGATAVSLLDNFEDAKLAVANPSTSALIPKVAAAQAGVFTGGQMIAGCMGPTLCDTGVIAGNTGCYNCFTGMSWKEKLKKKFDFIITSIKKSLK